MNKKQNKPDLQGHSENEDKKVEVPEPKAKPIGYGCKVHGPMVSVVYYASKNISEPMSPDNIIYGPFCTGCIGAVFAKIIGTVKPIYATYEEPK